ncbi:MAG: PAS domain S-box protein [Candidatus Pacebacteria bacterium]|nr:PAS domain S-box protein [Candidatus Paceibacterota bacterium]
MEKITTKEQLKESEEKYRTMIEHSNDMIWMLDPEGNFLFGNKRAEEITGFKLKDLKGKSFVPLISQKDLPRIMEIFKKNLMGETCQYEIDFESKEGKILNLLVNTAPIFLKGKIIGTTSFGKDITARKKIEEELRDNEEKYRTMIEHSNDIIWNLDTEGNFLFINKRAEEVTGFKVKDLIGKSFAPLLFEEDLPRTMEIFKKTLEGESCQYEISFNNKRGKLIHLLVNTAPLFSREKLIGTTSFGKDITERKKTEKELKDKMYKLEGVKIVNEKRYKKLIEQQVEIIRLKKRLGEKITKEKEIEEVEEKEKPEDLK